MHDCQKFREDLADLVFSAGPSAEMNSCPDCISFYQDAVALAGIMDSEAARVPELPEAYWINFNDRLRERLRKDQVPDLVPFRRAARTWRTPWVVRGAGFGVAAAAAIAAIWLGFRTTQPLIDRPLQTAADIELVDDHTAGLDPGTVEFLERSELFLRSFVKMEPTDVEDLEDARAQAELQLADLNQRKQAVMDFAPVQVVLEDYEVVLREIRNLDAVAVADLTDIQERIGRNGLVASMKAYQPRLAVIAD